jgi:hypothetical protein
MTTHTYEYWRDHGQPYIDADPIREQRAALVRIYGPDVLGEQLGTRGNQRHMTAEPPQDHTPFSATGWPVESPYGFGHALDWSGPYHERLANFWIAQRTAGRSPWIKYINIRLFHYSWQPTYSRRSSSDVHAHQSIRSDWTHRSIATGWPTLRRGATGPAVAGLQLMVNAHPTLPDLTEDGVFGPKTESAVKRLQQMRGIDVDGIAGPRTRIELEVF